MAIVTDDLAAAAGACHMKRTLHTVILLIVTLLLPMAPPIAAQDRDLFDDITSDMEDIRNLELSDPIDIMFMTRDEYEEQFAGNFMTEAETAGMADRQLVLVAFGLLELEDDLAALYAGLYAGGIAGYYDPATDRMVVIVESEDVDLTAINQVTFAHETVHALQDQRFDLLSFSDARTSGTNDESLAVTALIEGDASLAETDYLLSDTDLAIDYLTEVYTGERESSVWETTPPILLVPLSFPYSEGQRFVQHLYDEGGWDLVDDAYDDPPTTTEHILHPGKYLEGEEAIPVAVSDVGSALGDGWRVIEQDSWGEYTISIILEGADLGGEQIIDAHTGWGGDAYMAMTNDEDAAVAWVSEWDSEDDATEFLNALVAREAERLDADVEEEEGGVFTIATGDIVVQLVQDGARVTYLQGPDQAIVSAMSSAVAD